MITIINKTKLFKTYELDCSIPVKGGKKTKLAPVLNKKTKKKVARKGLKVECDNVLSLAKGEKRENLPDAISQSKSIIAAKLRGEILVKVQKPAKSKVAKKATKATKASANSSASEAKP